MLRKTILALLALPILYSSAQSTTVATNSKPAPKPKTAAAEIAHLTELSNHHTEATAILKELEREKSFIDDQLVSASTELLGNGSFVIATRDNAPHLFETIDGVARDVDLARERDVEFVLIRNQPGYEDGFSGQAGAISYDDDLSFLLIDEAFINEMSNEKEVKALLAHELGHIMHNHSKKKVIAKLSTEAAWLVLTTYLSRRLYKRLKIKYAKAKGARGKIFKEFLKKGLLYLIATRITISLILNAVSRSYERQADGVALKYDAEGLKGFLESYQENQHPHVKEIVEALESAPLQPFNTHPRMADRIKAAEEYAAAAA